jgi:hypothetical protein
LLDYFFEPCIFLAIIREATNGRSQIILHPNRSIAFANVPQSHAFRKIPVKIIAITAFSSVLKRDLSMNRKIIITAMLSRTIIVKKY